MRTAGCPRVGLTEQVERLSKKIAPEVYQVRAGTERDP